MENTGSSSAWLLKHAFLRGFRNHIFNYPNFRHPFETLAITIFEATFSVYEQTEFGCSEENAWSLI